jgi:uncharacterized protein YcaQ
MRVTLDHLRRYAIARSLFKPTTLGRAIGKLGFVQADPIRAPARAQDLILRHRVTDYYAGDLERRYPRMPIEEDFFVNYGFLPRAHQALMHPRLPKAKWTRSRIRNAQEVLQFIRDHGPVHPRVVDAHFAHGKITNWFGGTSNATTHLLDDMHYRGLIRVARREGGTRIYAARLSPAEACDTATAHARFDALADIVIHAYAPLPAASLGQLMSLLCRGVPQWRKHRAAALARARQRYASVRLGKLDWYWPAGESPSSRRWRPVAGVRLLTPFDPVVWDRRRFKLFWNWEYRFEAYTPAPKRKLGYYALPLLWQDQVIGWGNITATAGRLNSSFGYVNGSAPSDPRFHDALEAELARMETFLRLPALSPSETAAG